MIATKTLFLGLILSSTGLLLADGPADNAPEKVRPVPQKGIEPSPEQRKLLEDGLASLLAAIQTPPKPRDAAAALLLPDVQIYGKAVGDALAYGEFFKPEEFDKAGKLLQQGQERLAELQAGTPSWTTRAGLIARGYISKIDGSVQPYGLVVPHTYNPSGKERYRLDIWFHGRGEQLSELNFIDERQRDRGTFAPPDTIVLHPYGRYCNAFKFAGEVDVLEALEAVKARYRIDEDRIAVRGFSMGGAACWQFAVHYPDLWAAANPGAGFAETPEFLRVFQKESVKPAAFEQTLWRLYDCTGWAINLYHCPTVAYSGEIDSQKQAADIMAAALQKEGIELRHIIGPQTAHKYHPLAREAVDRLVGSIVEKGRDRLPYTLRFATYTLRYNRMHWLAVEGLGEHWKEARVEGQILADSTIALKTRNITALSLDFPAGWSPHDVGHPVKISIDGFGLESGKPFSDRSWSARLHRAGEKWELGPLPAGRNGVRKRPGLQGPIDDAFMDSFLFVAPSGKARHPQVESWSNAEMQRAVERWRRQFRGPARIKKDAEVTDADLQSANIVLWGDPASNSLLAKIAGKLPIQWSDAEIAAGAERFPAPGHALILIYPNPLNPERYVVVNSGFTYREYDDLNNARQVPKLPDWAVIDLSTPPGSRYPGKIAAAGFFGEEWELQPPVK